MEGEGRIRLAVEAEIRGHSGGRGLEGYASVFNVEARIGDYVERVMPGAFRQTLAENRDILALANHETNQILGRTAAGTLKLAEDSRGLHFSISELPETGYAADILALVRSGNIGGASFAFRPRPGGEVWAGKNRSLTNLHLFEVSVISGMPAYTGTAVHARAMPDLREQLRRRMVVATL